MMTGAWKKDLEGLVVTHAKRSSRRPWVHVDSRGLHALKPNMTRNCSRSRRSSREAGCIGDMDPCIDILVPDQSIRKHRLLAPTHPLKTSGSCHHMGSRWASSGVSIWPSSLHTTKRRYSSPKEHKEKSRTNNMQSVSMRVQDVAGPYVGSQIKFNESNSAQTCGSCDTCRNKKNRERRTQSSRCRKQQLSRTHVPFSKVGIEMVHEVTKRPSNSSAARRIPNISLSRRIAHHNKTAKVHSARA